MGKPKRLEDRILRALRQALEEGRLDAADHLLRAAECLCEDDMPGSTRASAYLALARAPLRPPAFGSQGDLDV